MIELSNNLFNQNCTTKPVPQDKIIFIENLIISKRYNEILGDGGDEGVLLKTILVSIIHLHNLL